MLWTEFRFLELTQIMRLDPAEVEFAALLSRARKGAQHMTDADWAMLESRLCTSHGGAALQSFVDKQMLIPPQVGAGLTRLR